MNGEAKDLEHIVNSNESTLLKTIRSYIVDNQMLATGIGLWLPRLLLPVLYFTEFEKAIDADIANGIEYASWAAATLSYIPWGLHGAGLTTYRKAWEHYKENGFKSLAVATGKGLLEDFRFLCWDMPKDIYYNKAPQYLTRLQNLYGKTKKHMPGTKS